MTPQVPSPKELRAAAQAAADAAQTVASTAMRIPPASIQLAAEMPDLIVDISQTALATGISNELFQPGAEVPKEFYDEKPIALRMVGTYHQFGAFISGVASLPRVVILTMHDVSLRPKGGNTSAQGIKTKVLTDGGTLALEGTVKTYRYVEDDEAPAAAPGAKPGAAAAKPAGGK